MLERVYHHLLVSSAESARARMESSWSNAAEAAEGGWARPKLHWFFRSQNRTNVRASNGANGACVATPP